MNKTLCMFVAAALGVATQGAYAACSDVAAADLVTAVNAAVTAGKATTGGYGLPMWASMVDETGTVCYVVASTPGTSTSLVGNNEWLGSRVISAQKANTANAFSLDGYAISTANLYSAVQPGGSLFGLQESNPVDASRSYLGTGTAFGTGAKDPLVGQRVGGVNVFGGGLALYKTKNGVTKKIGAIGVSGDTSCRDHANAWIIRENLPCVAAVKNTKGVITTPAVLGMSPTDTCNASGGVKGITSSNVDAGNTVQGKPSNISGTPVGDEMLISLLAGADVTTDTYWFENWSQPACPNTVFSASTGSIQLQ